MIIRIILGLFIFGIGIGVSILINIFLLKNRKKRFDTELRRMKNDAIKTAGRIVHEAKILSKANSMELREKFESEIKNRRRGFDNIEKKLGHKEDLLDKRLDSLNSKYDFLDKKEKEIGTLKEKVVQKSEELSEKISQQMKELQIISRLKEEDAKQLLLKRLENNLKEESGVLIKNEIERAKELANVEAQRIIVSAIQRYASDCVYERTTNTIALPNEEMKGRIIGRDGRNIRAIESATGVNILVDDTPEVVIISCFDPIRREVGKQVIEKLIVDGRIHPGRIEEIVKKVQDEIDKDVSNTGYEAVLKMGIKNVSEPVVKLIGRLKYRYSFSQNVLNHSVETAHFMDMIAAELHLDRHKARKIGLLHDIGKAIDHEIEGSHASIGADFLNKHGEEDPNVINAVASHHEEIEQDNVYSVLVSACDALSASRPGARTESTELYLKRLKKLEEIATEFEGVTSCFAFQAGRELRVVVSPEKISDEMAYSVARDICLRVEKEVVYPGSIQVTVIRETRCIEYAK